MTVTLSPSSGPAGTTVSVKAGGFPRRANGAVTFDGATVSALKTSRRGVASASIAVPNGPARTATVTLAVAGVSSSATFLVTAPTAPVPPPVPLPVPPPTPVPPPPSLAYLRRADVPAQFSSTNASQGVLAAVTRNGEQWTRATYNGSGLNGFTRGLMDVTPWDYREGKELRFGMEVELYPGFLAANAYIDLMRLDNYDISPANADHLGVSIEGASYGGGARLVNSQVGRNNQTSLGAVLPHASIPEGRPFLLDAQFLLHRTSGQARNRVWVNGSKVLDNTLANLFGTFVAPYGWCRYGIVAVAGQHQTRPLGLHMRKCYVAQPV